MNAKSLCARDVMTKSLVCARPEQDLLEVESLLVQHRISGVPVVDEGRLVGVVAASDVARVQVLMNSLDGQVDDAMDWSQQADGFQHADPPEFHGFQQMISRLKVKDAMRDEVISCPPQTPVAELARLMVKERVHRVIVVEHERPLGLVSSLDLARVLAESIDGTGK